MQLNFNCSCCISLSEKLTAVVRFLRVALQQLVADVKPGYGQLAVGTGSRLALLLPHQGGAQIDASPLQVGLVGLQSLGLSTTSTRRQQVRLSSLDTQASLTCVSCSTQMSEQLLSLFR